MNNEGLKHVHKLMHAFIEGIAAGVYDSVEDIQNDAKDYLSMEIAVEKLSKWKGGDIADLAEVFDGLSKSLDRQRVKKEEESAWAEIKSMPKIGEENAK